MNTRSTRLDDRTRTHGKNAVAALLAWHKSHHPHAPHHVHWTPTLIALDSTTGRAAVTTDEINDLITRTETAITGLQLLQEAETDDLAADAYIALRTAHAAFQVLANRAATHPITA